MHGYITRSVRLLAVPLLLAGVVAGISPVTAATAWARSPGPAASFTISGALSGVAATSAGNAWAVGSTGSGKALIVRWNGTAWTQVPSPAPAGSGLSGVAATSATNAWAVGSTGSGKALIVRWNGTAWTQVPSPAPAGSGLSGVAATSATNAWAVGSTGSGKALIVRWNGTAWTQVPSPSPGTGAGLYGVAATSAGVAWAVGYTATSTGTKTLILQWNGAAWKRVPSPSPAGNGAVLSGVAATSTPTSSAWATGCSGCAFGGFAQSLIVRWNGTAWKQVPSPSPAGGGDLFGVAAVSASSAWAVGGYYAVSGSSFSVKTLTAGWNGTAWKRAPSPSPGTEASLRGVAAVSASSAWAVGGTDTSAGSKTLILRWNGKTWKLS